MESLRNLNTQNTNIRLLPERHGKRWEEDEVQYILGRVKHGIYPAQIAVEVKRTPGGVTSRLKEIAYDEIKHKSMSIEDASALTGITADSINDYIKKRDLTEELKEDKKNRPPELKQQSLRPFFLNKPEESVIDVLVEIRDLLRQVVRHTQVQSIPDPISTPTRSK